MSGNAINRGSRLLTVVSRVRELASGTSAAARKLCHGLRMAPTTSRELPK